MGSTPQQQREYYVKHREDLLAYQVAYREANREKVAVRRHAHYAANREELLRKKKLWHQSHKGLRRQRQLHGLYGLSLEEFKGLLGAQDGRCAICRRVLEEGGQNGPHVDHEHGGMVRGILCKLCNPGLGYFRDAPALLRRAADYLEVHEAEKGLVAALEDYKAGAKVAAAAA